MNRLLKIYQFIFTRKIFYRFNLHMYKLSLRGLGILNSENSHISGEDYFYNFLKSNSIPIHTIFDIGANNGSYAHFLSTFFPKAKIYAFEPNPNMYSLLKKTSNKYIKTFNIGFSDKKNIHAKLYDFAKDAELKSSQPTSTLASNFKSVINDLHGQKADYYDVELHTLDNFCTKNNIRTIDLLKIDTEGSEYRVLKGAKKLILNRQIKIIFFEFNEMNVYAKVFLRDFFDLLSNYNLYRLLPDGLVVLDRYRPKEHEIFAFQNIVAIDKQLDLL